MLSVQTGTKGRTNPINLDTAFHDDFEAGQTDVFEIEAVSVGEVVMVQMELRSVLPGRGWCLSYVSVTDVMAEKTVRCPCYQWLTSTQPSILLRRSEGQGNSKVNMEINRRHFELNIDINQGYFELNIEINLGHSELNIAINLGHYELNIGINQGHYELNIGINQGHYELNIEINQGHWFLISSFVGAAGDNPILLPPA